MQSELHHITAKDCLKQQLDNSFRMHNIFLTVFRRLGNVLLKSAKDFIN